MKITRSQLRRIIKEELERLTEIGPGVGMAPLTFPGELKHATTDPHNMLAAFSLLDPTMATELADSALYALQGDLDSAALVLAFSAGGLAAGAATVKAMKLAKGLKKAGLAAEEATKLADDVVELASTTSTAGKTRPPTKIPSKKHRGPTGGAAAAAAREIPEAWTAVVQRYGSTEGGRVFRVNTQRLMSKGGDGSAQNALAKLLDDPASAYRAREIRIFRSPEAAWNKSAAELVHTIPR